jgi:hypothetical protein
MLWLAAAEGEEGKPALTIFSSWIMKIRFGRIGFGGGKKDDLPGGGVVLEWCISLSVNGFLAVIHEFFPVMVCVRHG